jgi:O-acetyl-ADP-ribose deacetylase (regulator of RNase III)
VRRVHGPATDSLKKTMTTLTGDLLQLALDGIFDVIVHGCNCQFQMGKGIALSIKGIFPKAHAADRLTPRGNVSKFGTISGADHFC